MRKSRILKVARGEEPAPLVLKNANVVNVFTEQLEFCDVAVCDGKIAGVGSYQGKKEIDLKGKILCPGFMDGHMHFESSLIAPWEYEKAVLKRGTTAVVADPHEIANVSGTEGIDCMLSMVEQLKINAFISMPSCVPSCSLEENGYVLHAKDLKSYYRNCHVVGLAEVMDAGSVIGEDKDMIRKIKDAKIKGKNIDGHAPGLSGKDLCAYIAAGVSTDHECTSAKEAFEKLRQGQWIMIREGTAAKNMEALIPLCEDPYYHRCLFVTDDCHPEDLLRDGHMDAVIRKAIALGVPGIRAVKMCTYNTALCFGLKDYGAVAPGYYADLTVMDNLTDCKVSEVFLKGEPVVRNGKLLLKDTRGIRENLMGQLRDQYPEIWNSFHVDEIRPDMFYVSDLKKRMKVIGLCRQNLLTGELILDISEEQRANNGVDLVRDVVKMAVIERHHGTGHVGIGYLGGYGLKRGAIATSVAHDAHNLIVVGTNDKDMYLAAVRACELQGALVTAENGKILHELPLPIAGIMSDRSVSEVDERLQELKNDAYMLGVSKDIDPFMTLGFASLPVIPKLRLNGRGLIDVIKNEIVPVTFD